MHSDDGPVGVRPEEDDAESFGSLRLVGNDGRFRTTISDEGLKLSRSDGRGIRLNLSALESIRMTSKAAIPWGWAVFSMLLLIYGIRLAPQGFNIYPLAISGAIIIIWLIYRKDQLIIDTKNGDRYRILGRTENLIRLSKFLEMMLDGLSLSDARAEIRVDLTLEPSLHDEFVSRMNSEIDLAKALATHTGIGGFRDMNNESPEVQAIQKNDFSFDATLFDSPNSAFSTLRSNGEMPETGIFGTAHRGRSNVALASTNEELRNASNAFDAPNYNEESAISDGGIFGDLFSSIEEKESTPIISNYGRPSIQEDLELAQKTYAEVTSLNEEERPLPVSTRPMSSMQLIRQAQDQFAPTTSILPPPTSVAIREECISAGLVADAKKNEIVEAELISKDSKDEIPNELNEYPSFSRMLRRSDHQSRLIIKQPRSNRSSTVINLLRSFNPQRASRRAMGLLRLRSDQDHQAQRSSFGIETTSRNSGGEKRSDGYSAAMESITATISERETSNDTNFLKLEEMNPTKNSEDNSQYPGMRRIG